MVIASIAAQYYQAEAIVGDERERLIIEHLPQVRLVARKIHGRPPESVSLDDRVSAGVLRLIQAIDSFDSAQNVKLRTYAEHGSRGAVLESLRAQIGHRA